MVEPVTNKTRPTAEAMSPICIVIQDVEYLYCKGWRISRVQLLAPLPKSGGQEAHQVREPDQNRGSR
ncbi:hypothetical protein E2C01_034047 [Portunus trituberculatus]|uniref:Uncharacterized protein n=1 Tax=Portunus trituberculatus TaxID=210409 RepID=A0A5B7F526_PORTR|nr:hypothetical protein [Portunus trituberculatus]